MLCNLSIRDFLLIERLDIAFGAGLTVLTGETGAGKSILLDSLGLALGDRPGNGLVRPGAEQASVTAGFSPTPGHPARALLAERGLEAEDQIVVRRVLANDGRSRAFVNDQAVAVGLLRRLGALLVEVQGQHAQMGLADPASHGSLLDAFGVSPALRDAVVRAWQEWRQLRDQLETARAATAAAERDRDWLHHAVAELAKIAPQQGEEERLAAERLRLQQNERYAEAIAAALAELTPRDRRTPGCGASLRAAARLLQRFAPAGQDAGPLAPALAALERAQEALEEAEDVLGRLGADSDADPKQLERAEERLFALRSLARKHGVSVEELPVLFDNLSARLAALDTNASELSVLEQRVIEARAGFVSACQVLSAQRRAAAERLQNAVSRELPALRLEKARFVVELAEQPEANWSAGGTDAIRFLVATNPGQSPGPLDRVASGGELSRLMLALKVALAGESAVPTLVFDEVDSGIGGATAAAVGERLARVARALQVLVVTHSPQVAAYGRAHFRVSKQIRCVRAVTVVELLDSASRREEIARMLAGEIVTEAARGAADDLLGVMA
ncbi:MAG: DNA repair protein RecN [Acetobacteraceae bacterium]|nr:DNA repair protein RecN [Acetobacteraceae bacterium]MBV8590665.1 DNA repair protein RecN [Acetobacteraceae bacterium]